MVKHVEDASLILEFADLEGVLMKKSDVCFISPKVKIKQFTKMCLVGEAVE